MALIGVNCPNRQWERWTEAEVKAVWDLRPQVLLILAYGTGIYAQLENRRIVHEYLASNPYTVVMLRMYAELIPTYDAALWADECYHRWVWWGIPNAEVIPANEINLAAEGGNEDWHYHNEWLIKFARRWHEWPNAPRLHLPAFAPVGNYRAGLELITHEMFDEVDVHCYPGTLDDWRYVADLFQRKVTITEYNGVDPAQYAATWDHRVRAACWFILGGTDDQQQYHLIGSPYYDSLKHVAHSTKPIAGGPAMSEIAEKRRYAEWSLLRIERGEDPLDRAAFAEHIRATGGDPSDLRRYGMPDQATAARELKEALEKARRALAQI